MIVLGRPRKYMHKIPDLGGDPSCPNGKLKEKFWNKQT
jgi:hypothetical protein